MTSPSKLTMFIAALLLIGATFYAAHQKGGLREWIPSGPQSSTQTLEYDEENRLSVVTGPGYAVAMGYDGAGERLWRYSTTPGSQTVWIGGIYEERGGKQLCHVFAGGRRVATFEPQAGTYAATGAPDDWVLFRQRLDRAAAWPFQDGRAPWTVLVFAFAGLLGICAAARRQSGLAASGFRVRPAALWQQAVTLTVITSLLLATTESRVNAQSYNPVFYYYHPDHLGSSTVLTDRTGNRVDFYGYTAYGRQQYNEATPALPVSHRFTGQILDEETGLYYYGARYYDPELGRFIQADTIVPRATDPQMLNRYTYCGNNPLKYVDPSGHEFLSIFLAVVAVAAVGAGSGAATSAAFGGDPAKGAISGAIGGAFGFVAGPVGGVAGAAVSASITGDDVGIAVLGAVVGAAIGFGVGQLGQVLISQGANAFVVQAGGNLSTGAIAGGIAAEMSGGDFAQGAAYGAAGAGVAFGMHRSYTQALAAASTRVSEEFSKVQAARIKGGLRVLATTRVGQRLLWSALLQGGADFYFTEDDDDLGAGMSPHDRREQKFYGIRTTPPSVFVNPRNYYGLSPDQVTRAFDGQVAHDEYSPFLAGRPAAAWAWALGHELGHTVLGYPDVGPNNNATLVDNPLRRELGFGVRRHYQGQLVGP